VGLEDVREDELKEVGQLVGQEGGERSAGLVDEDA